MIRCLFIRKKIYEYVDGALPEEQAVAVANHLEKCPACRREEAGIRELLSHASRPVPVPSEDFWKKFQAELDDKLNRELVPEPRVPAFVLRLRPALTFAAVCCLAVIAFSFSLKTAPAHLAQREEQELVEALSSLEGPAADLVPLEELDELLEVSPA